MNCGLMVRKANFLLKKKLDNYNKMNSNQFADFQGGGRKLKFVQGPDGFELVSGEIGGEVEIENLNLSPNWALENLAAYLRYIIRDEIPEGATGYDDGYPDELNQFLIALGGSGTLRKRQFSFRKSNTDLRLSAGLDLDLDDESFSLGTGDKPNIMHAHFDMEDIGNFPASGVFTMTGVSGSYDYSKNNPSYWSLGAHFSLYQFIREIYMFEGHAQITSDLDFDSISFGLTSLTTPVIGTDLYIDWTNGDALACLLYGRIRHDFPMDCPDVEGCGGEPFELVPADEDSVFEGLGVGFRAELTLREDDTDQVYEAFGGRFEDIVNGAMGLRVYGIESQTSYDYDVSIQAVGKAELKMPKVTKDWFIIPESWKEGKTLLSACLSLGYFEVTQEWWWLGHKEKNLGIHSGLHAESEVFFDEPVSVFIPFDHMEDKDGDRVSFVLNMKVLAVDEPSDKSPFAQYARGIDSARAVGDTVWKTFSVDPGERLLIVDLVSSDNTFTMVMPDGTTLTQDSPSTDSVIVEKAAGRYTEIAVANPPSGEYGIYYILTGDEYVKVFGTNPAPDGMVSIAGDTVSFSLQDAEDETMQYSLALVDDREDIVYFLIKDETTTGGQFDYVIGPVSHLETGEYRAMLVYNDTINPARKAISSETIYLQKSIGSPENIRALCTNDYVELFWDADPAATGYQVSISCRDQLIYETRVRADRLKVTDLLEEQYTAEIYGYDEEGNTGESASLVFDVAKVVSSVIPDTVSGVTVEIGVDQAVVEWTPPANADFYTVGLFSGTETILSNAVALQPSLTVGKGHFGKLAAISIVSHSFANNASEPYVEQISLFTSEDTDEDGLPDMWEARYFGSLKYDASDDPDADGYDNGTESTLGTHPCMADTDGDGIDDPLDPRPLNNIDANKNTVADDWEDFFQITDIMEDTDSDGYPNYIEYLAGLDPTVFNEPGIDVANYENIDFSPVVVANVEEISMAKLDEPAEIDLSDSFDINGNPLSFEWKFNGDSVENAQALFSIDTSKTGMNRVEVKVSDGTKTVYRKYSVFVSDGDTGRANGGSPGSISLARYRIDLDAACMPEGEFLLAADISLERIPVEIMGRKIVSHALVYIYSGGSRLASPATITPYMRQYDGIDPYVFNYDTSVWTNLNTGESFDPVFRSKAVDQPPYYTVATRETGILVFARIPETVELSAVTNLNSGTGLYTVDLSEFASNRQLEEIADISISNPSVVSCASGSVAGTEELRIDVIGPGRSEIVIEGRDGDGESVAYRYILDIQEGYWETDIDGDDIDDDWELAYLGHLGSDGSSDFDDDGVTDLVEYQKRLNPSSLDSDGDGIQDGTEMGYTADDVAPDTDTEIFRPDLDPTTTTDPLVSDTDGDTFDDGFEDADSNGRVDLKEYDPKAADSHPGMKGDVNGENNIELHDALTACKIAAGTDPGFQVFQSADSNGDGKIGMEDACYILNQISESLE